MRILVFSDLHGNGFTEAERLTAELEPDWVVLCGDMLPDFNNRPSNKRLDAQLDFWREHRGCFLREGAVTTFILGNHEQSGFLDEDMLRLPDSLDGRVVRLEGIPGDAGPFSFAKGSPESVLEAELQAQHKIAPDPFIYLSHAPPYGSRDKTLRGTHIGHRPLFRHLQSRDWPQALVVCGHTHQSYGHEEVGGTTILNAATGYALLTWEQGKTCLLEMHRLVEGGNFWDSP